MSIEDPYILLIDDSAFRRACYSSLLESWAESLNLSVRAVTTDAVTTNLAQLCNCQLVLLNLGSQSVKEEATLDLVRLLRSLIPNTPVAVISDNTDPGEVKSVFKSGANGFIPSTLNPSVALQSFTFIVKGGAFFPPSALLQNVELQELEPKLNGADFGSRKPEDNETEGGTSCGSDTNVEPPIVRLSNKQRQVLEQLCHGRSNKVIAGALDITEATVKLHVHQIIQKLGVENRTQAAIQAVENGLIRPNGIGDSVQANHEPTKARL